MAKNKDDVNFKIKDIQLLADSIVERLLELDADLISAHVALEIVLLRIHLESGLSPVNLSESHALILDKYSQMYEKRYGEEQKMIEQERFSWSPYKNEEEFRASLEKEFGKEFAEEAIEKIYNYWRGREISDHME